MAATEIFGTRARLDAPDGPVEYHSLRELDRRGVASTDRLPYTIKVMLENALRAGAALMAAEDLERLARWSGDEAERREFPFFPARVVLQDFTGVPVVVDLAAMRAAAARLGGDPRRINPLVRTELVIDHSVQVDLFGTTLSFQGNVEREYERNAERYALLRWAQGAFSNFQVVPPGTGIIHQVNLEYLASVVATRELDGRRVAFPDTLVGTDSHTTMIGALGVLGWGVGGIEAEAVQLGQPLYLLTPRVVGFRFTGRLPDGTTATDLVLTVTQMLRARGVVDRFVEFYGPGLSGLALPDRATISNMAPEYGATAATFPVDDETLLYLRATGRPEALVGLVERYAKEQGLFRTDATPDPAYTETVELDLGTVEPSVAGPRRPQDRVPLGGVRESFRGAFPSNGAGNNADGGLRGGDVVIAAITSCTNTSNPSVMIGAGLVAKKAVERGLDTAPHVKTSLAPGSQVVTDYLDRAGLTPYLEALGFHLVGYGCTTCIGNSGELPEPVARAIEERDLAAVAVLSGNRNFEGRINAHVRAAYLASPPLVVAYALAGSVDRDLLTEPLGRDPNGAPVYLADLWPSREEVAAAVEEAVGAEMFTRRYAEVFEGDELWRALPTPEGELYAWDPDSTYVQEPPYFADLAPEPEPVREIRGARVLALLGDSVTTDHISPAGSIPKAGAAGQYLIAQGVPPREFNSFGARRGNHEVMVRGTFGNIRLRNRLTPEREGPWTVHHPSGETLSIYDASERYREEGTPLLVIAGREYGTGSSRDWAAKGTLLLGVRAVLAESYERIHRSNLVGMGVLPLQFREGENAESLGLDGTEEYDLMWLADGEDRAASDGDAGPGGGHVGPPLRAGGEVTIRVRHADGAEREFRALVRIDGPMELAYYRHGGILPMVLRGLLPGEDVSAGADA